MLALLVAPLCHGSSTQACNYGPEAHAVGHAFVE